jgi:hypothetical protein
MKQNFFVSRAVIPSLSVNPKKGMKLKNAMSEYSEEDLEGNEPLLLLCDFIAKALRYCLHTSHRKKALDGEYLV